MRHSIRLSLGCVIAATWCAAVVDAQGLGPRDVNGLPSRPAEYLLQVTALSVAAAWLYWRTGGSLLLVMLLHAAVNNTKDIVPSAVPGATNIFALSPSLVAWLTVVFLWIPAVYFLVRMSRTATLGSGEIIPDSRRKTRTATTTLIT
jgi:membrane protease YdiL (CAAX protease family)